MRIITMHSQAAATAERWKAQYYDAGKDMWNPTATHQSGAIYEQLVALGPAPDPADVVRVIGNDSWIDTGRCAECWVSGRDPWRTLEPRLRIGREDPNDNASTLLCFTCVRSARTLIASNS